MDVKVSGRHLEITEAIRDYAGKRVAKLPKYFDRIQVVSVVADKKDRTHELEIIVQADRAEPFIGRATGQDLYACIDAAVDKIERQLADHKGKVRHRMGKTAARGG
jgi:putative sigma-54 modulation protein